MIKITIPGNPRTKKNSQQIMVNRKTGRPFVMPSAAFRQYQEEAGTYILPATRKGINYPVAVRCVYYMHTRRAVDLTNLLESTDDILVHCGVLADDNCRIIASHDGSRVRYDKQNPRTEITITRFEETGND